MVNYNPQHWVKEIFGAYSRSVMRALIPAMLLMGSLTLLICFIFIDYFGITEEEFKSTTSMHSLLGIVLGLFLVFRTNSAYDRWWEGRKHWGSLVNNTRNFSFKINAFLRAEDKKSVDWFNLMICNFVIALKEHLRNGVKIDQLEKIDDSFLENITRVKHKPAYMLGMLYDKVNTLYKEGKLTGDQFFILDKEIKEFTDIMGACERIKNTPIPFSYSMFIKKFVFTYSITLPFGFVTSYGYTTIPIVLFIFFILLSVELIAEEIEDPFGSDINDLPLDQISLNIRYNVREIL
ncbi:MAG TPA: bestrophin family ion channel, partial [Cyclobacteriaceae bacterium]|nr:bestrophin family ion channel [Cyclobacteriaceae bacterium]